MHCALLRKICCSTVFTPSWEICRKHAAPIWNLCMPLYEFLLRLCCSLDNFFFCLMRCCCIAQLNGSWAEAAALQCVCVYVFKGGVQAAAAAAAAAGLMIHSIDFHILLLTSRFQSSPRASTVTHRVEKWRLLRSCCRSVFYAPASWREKIKRRCLAACSLVPAPVRTGFYYLHLCLGHWASFYGMIHGRMFICLIYLTIKV